MAKQHEINERKRKAAYCCEQFNRLHPSGSHVYVKVGGGDAKRTVTKGRAAFLEREGKFVPAVRVEGIDDWVALAYVEVVSRAGVAHG